MDVARRVLGLVVGGFVGLVACYFPAAYAACTWFWPDSNMCGLPAVMMAAPLGGIIGAMIGVKIVRRAERRVP